MGIPKASHTPQETDQGNQTMLDKNIIDAALHEIEFEALHLKALSNVILAAKTDYITSSDMQELFSDILHKALRIEEATERLSTMLLEVPQ